MQDAVPPQPPTPPAPPAPAIIPVPGGRVVVVPGGGGSPTAVYEGLKARAEVLSDQHQRLDDQRGEITSRLQQGNLDDADRGGLRTQLADVDGRLASLNKQIAANDEALAQAAGVPGAIVREREAPPNGPPEGVIAIPIVITIFVFFPLAIAWARRLWKKPVAGPAALPPEFAERMARLEQAVESVAEEVERIGEGQRFVTKLFAESPRPLELPK